MIQERTIGLYYGEHPEKDKKKNKKKHKKKSTSEKKSKKEAKQNKQEIKQEKHTVQTQFQMKRWFGKQKI